ncbi:FMN-binding domain protein [compost metagenome]
MAKMDKKWVVLCSAAIAAVYTAGYMSIPGQASPQEAASYAVNSPAAPSASPQPSPSAAQSTGKQTAPSAASPSPQSTAQARGGQKPSGSAPTANSQSGSAANPTASPNSGSSTNQTAAAYKDGTFTGTGSNRRGSIQVDVTVKSGKIYAVEVSRYAMHYSQSDIVDLPQEVIANQSAKVKNVSGATFSVQAFTDAVQNALNQAQNG